MCEFKIRKLGANWTSVSPEKEEIAHDIILFRYSPDGTRAVFSDILGRTVDRPPLLVMEVNMLPRGHDITVLESPLLESFIPLLYELEKCRQDGAVSSNLRERVEAHLGQVKSEVAGLE